MSPRREPYQLEPEHYQVNKIYESGDPYLEDLLSYIEKATISVYVESYIFELPEPGRRLLTLLEMKRQQGLDVKIMVDGVGSLRYLQELQSWSEGAWVPLRIYNPLPWRRRWRVLFFPLFVLNILWHTRTLNRRDHRKMVVIDNKIAFLGSINFSKVHFRTFSKEPWFDLALRIEGNLVQSLSRAFLLEFESEKPTPQVFWLELKSLFFPRREWFPLSHKLRLNSHFIMRYLFWRDLLFRIRKATKRVYIMNAYFVPHRTLISSLIVAVKSGVEVVVLLPSKSDVPVVQWFAPMVYPKLLRNGVQIREMQSQMIHTKSVIVDDWALVGSNNLNYRSLIQDLEVEAVVQEANKFAELLAIWRAKVSDSRNINLSEVESLAWWRWLRYRLVLLIRYFV